MTELRTLFLRIWHKTISLEIKIKWKEKSTCSLPMATRQKRFPWLLSASSSERVTPERDRIEGQFESQFCSDWTVGISAQLSANNRLLPVYCVVYGITCRRPGFDEACAVHDHILRFALLRRTQSIPAEEEMVFICVCLQTEVYIYRQRAALPVSASQEVESVHGHRLYGTHSTSEHRETQTLQSTYMRHFTRVKTVYIAHIIKDFQYFFWKDLTTKTHEAPAKGGLGSIIRKGL